MAARRISTDLDEAEDYVRNRLVWAADSWQAKDALEHEDKRRRSARLKKALRGDS
jgi:hypothetical protein